MTKVLSPDTVQMMVSEYEYAPNRNQEESLYANLCRLAESHELLRRDAVDLADVLIKEVKVFEGDNDVIATRYIISTILMREALEKNGHYAWRWWLLSSKTISEKNA